MLRLPIDENFDHRSLRGLKSRVPEIDFIVVQQIGLAGFKDLVLLKWAAENERTMLTHDISTMVPDAEHLLLRGEPMFGLIVVPDKMSIGRAIEDLGDLLSFAGRISRSNTTPTTLALFSRRDFVNDKSNQKDRHNDQEEEDDQQFQPSLDTEISAAQTDVSAVVRIVMC